MNYHRGAVWYVDMPGIGDKPVIIVSADPVSRALQPIVARLTSVDRERQIPTAIPIPAGHIAGLDVPTWVICHDLFTLQKPYRRHLGTVAPAIMVRIEAGLRAALGLSR